MKKKYAALFVRSDSAYKKRPDWDAYDAERDAKTFDGGLPCVCHPPCRAWGALAHMSFRGIENADQLRHEEKKLAVYAIDVVRRYGGIVEHPSKSKIFKHHIPNVNEFPDESGGYTIEIDQFDFGHVAHKPTKLYICGVNMKDLPALPPRRTDIPELVIDRDKTGRGRKTCTQYQREYTPEDLIDWFEIVLSYMEMK